MPGTRAGSGATALWETTKPGITRLVTITAGVGFALSAVTRPAEPTAFVVLLLATAVGTALSAAGANAINQWMERERDARMPRTRNRPLPTRRVAPMSVLLTGIVLCVLGVAVLAGLVGPAAALISLSCVLVYVLAYTPMKPVSTLAAYVGTYPGAAPTLIGWTAAAEVMGGPGGLASLTEWGGWSLFAIMTVWQLPHFFALAWMYKDDYAAGGYKVLPAVDPTGARTARAILIWTGLLVVVSFTPMIAMPEFVGAGSAVVAAGVSVFFGRLAWKLTRERTRENARAVFLASLVHMPLLFAAVTIEALVRAWVL
jgi:protoheme IX farnesyltransferase